MSIDAAKSLTATFETSRGTVVVDLFPKEAPKTVNNFVFLAREGFYDGTTFHRVIPKLHDSGGDPTASGRGGPGYKFEDELKVSYKKHQARLTGVWPTPARTQMAASSLLRTSPLTGLDVRSIQFFGQVRSGQSVVNAVKQGDQLISVRIEEV